MPKTLDLTGKRFGKLTVVNKEQGREDRYFIWRCNCDCGNITLVNTKRLTRGTVTDCGCEKKRRYGSIPENLKGQRFGRLVVLDKADSRKGRVYWSCRCDCGNNIIVAAHELKSGKTKSCGCIKRESHTTLADLSGLQINNITVLQATNRRDYKGSVIWECQCVCGKKFYLSADALRHGNYKSCGCGRIAMGHELQSHLTFVDGTCVEWLEKRKHRSDNTSGCTGVYITKKGTFRASITLCGRRYSLGTFKTMKEAAQSRRHAEDVLHGGFITEYKNWKAHALQDSQWAEEHPFRFDPDIMCVTKNK